MVLLFCIPLGLNSMAIKSSFSAPMSEFDPGTDIVVYAVNIVALRKVFAYTFGFLDRLLVD